MAAKKYFTKEDYLRDAIKVHGLKYDYSELVFTGLQNKITYKCPIHGSIIQRADSHLRGHGCGICNKTCSNSNWILKAIKVHGDTYSYPKTNYVHSEDYVTITCKIHGDFEQLACNHLQGHGCPKCGVERQTEKCTSSREEFIHKSDIVHDKFYDYSEVVYVNHLIPVIIKCPIHGKFEQAPNKHLLGSGCQTCGKLKAAESNKSTTIDYIDKCIEVQGLKYDYSKVVYTGASDKVIIGCSIHGDFEQRANNHLLGQGCPFCNFERTVSQDETRIFDYIESIIPLTVERNNRIILGEFEKENELDIYIPSKKIAFEYNGIYWHSELKKDMNYHLRKTEECLKQGIRLIHIFEDEWLDKQAIVKSRIANLLGVSKYHTYARKCSVRQIDGSEAKEFLERHHIQGYSPASISYGLFTKPKIGEKSKLLSVMTFCQLRKNLGSTPIDGHYELLRFCNFQNLNVVGGASKLLKQFIRDYRPKNIISYCDRRWSEGNLYEKLGFTLSHINEPNYFYIIKNKRENRWNYRKDILVSKHGCPQSMTEKDFCFSKKWYRIYDCGTKVYTLNCTQKE